MVIFVVGGGLDGVGLFIIDFLVMNLLDREIYLDVEGHCWAVERVVVGLLLWLELSV